MYKQVLGGRGQGMSVALTRDQPHGMCVGQSWAGIATHSWDTAGAFGSEQWGHEDANVAQHFQMGVCGWGCCMGAPASVLYESSAMPVSLAGKTIEQEFKAFLVLALAGRALELAHSSLSGKSCQLAFLRDVSAAAQAPAQNIHLVMLQEAWRIRCIFLENR